MDMAVEARYSHVPLTAKERGLFLVNAHFLPTTKKLIIIRNSRKGRPRNGGGDHHAFLRIVKFLFFEDTDKITILKIRFAN
jgi:hypothetical protein